MCDSSFHVWSSGFFSRNLGLEGLCYHISMVSLLQTAAATAAARKNPFSRERSQRYELKHTSSEGVPVYVGPPPEAQQQDQLC